MKDSPDRATCFCHLFSEATSHHSRHLSSIRNEPLDGFIAKQKQTQTREQMYGNQGEKCGRNGGLGIDTCNIAVCVSVARLCLTLCNPWAVACQSPPPVGFPSKNTGVSCHFLLQGIFPTQGPNPGLQHCSRFFTVKATREAHKIWITNENLLWSTGNSSQGSAVTLWERNPKKRGCMCTCG